VPAAQVAAVTAVIKHAYESHNALGFSVAGKLWQVLAVGPPLSGQQFQIPLFSQNLALRLYRLLVPSG
jgi:hypothetical protein